jgi:hypothetical protein
MPRKKLTKAQGEKLLADTKQRQRLLQEARTSERLDQLEIQACCEELVRQLRLEYTLDTSEDEKDLVQKPKDGSDKKYTELESPD